MAGAPGGSRNEPPLEPSQPHRPAWASLQESIVTLQWRPKVIAQNRNIFRVPITSYPKARPRASWDAATSGVEDNRHSAAMLINSRGDFGKCPGLTGQAEQTRASGSRPRQVPSLESARSSAYLLAGSGQQGCESRNFIPAVWIMGPPPPPPALASRAQRDPALFSLSCCGRVTGYTGLF